MKLLPLVLAAVLLSACTPADTPAPTPPPVSLPSYPAGVLRSVSTPGVVVDDMDLKAGKCTARTIDAAAGLVLPDPACTPGAVDPAVTQANLGSTVCGSVGYTGKIRPPSSATGRAKAALLGAYSMDYSKTIELDHLVPLSLGGASSTSNLWPEPNKAGATSTLNPKDETEGHLLSLLCSRQVPLADVQKAVATDWTKALAVLGWHIADQKSGQRLLCPAGTNGPKGCVATRKAVSG